MSLKNLNNRLKLLSVGSDAKTVKGEKFGIATAILYLAPAMEAAPFVGKPINLCPHASRGCESACLFKAGRGAFSNVYKARIRKTVEFITNRNGFILKLYEDLRKFSTYCALHGLRPAVRLNGTSDLPFHKLIEMQWFEEIAFYDYTKDAKRARQFAKGKLPSNYSITFSLSESNELQAREMAKLGVNIAAVFDTLPSVFFGKPVINGDESDARFLDRKGVIVGLTAKGPAKRDKSGFVQRINQLEAIA